jgi:TolB-like protein
VCAADIPKIAIVPFKINAEKDLSFLQSGITDMLAFRISVEGRITVADRDVTEKAIQAAKGSLNRAAACEIGSALGADYVIFGSLTMFGNTININGELSEVAGKKPLLNFSELSQTVDDVIPQINRFATDATHAVASVAAGSASVPPPSVRKPEPQQATRPRTEAPPEAVQKTESRVISENKAPNPAFIPAKRQENTNQEFWKSQDFDDFIKGLALGDTNGDGKIETVMISSHQVYVLTYENGRFSEPDAVKEEGYHNFIGADVADINNNGRAEIFVTSLNAQRNAVNSFVLEWNGQNYTEIVKDSPWYYRITELPGNERVLLGQQNNAGDPFSGQVFEMAWKNSKYVPEIQVAVLERNNLMGLSFGDVTDKGKNVAAAYNKADYIELIDPSGEVIWTGSEIYGGSMSYYVLPKTEPGVENREYLPMRLLVRDMDADGETEVIVAKNYEMASGLLKTFRKFTKFRIESLIWNGLGLATNWKTEENSGHVGDFAVGDFDNDGLQELVVAVVLKDGTILAAQPQSTIIAYELNK